MSLSGRIHIEKLQTHGSARESRIWREGVIDSGCQQIQTPWWGTWIIQPGHTTNVAKSILVSVLGGKRIRPTCRAGGDTTRQ